MRATDGGTGERYDVKWFPRRCIFSMVALHNIVDCFQSSDTYSSDACSFLVTSCELTREQLETANELQRRRGPDGTSVVRRHGLTFVHNLLSLTGAHTPQPFFDADGGAVALFNGEVYNWRELGAELSVPKGGRLPLRASVLRASAGTWETPRTQLGRRGPQQTENMPRGWSKADSGGLHQAAYSSVAAGY